MKVTVKGLTEKGIEENDWRDCFAIYIDGNRAFSVHDGEPEDNSLVRNFNDCHEVPELLRKAYEAGKRGEPFEIENVACDDIDDI